MADLQDRGDAAKEGRQYLNPVDRVMWCVDRTLRSMGYPGFRTQMFVWLSGRADVARLRRAIERLSRRHGVVASRLVESEDHDDAEVYWRLRPGETCPLHETELPSAEESCVLDHASDLLSAPRDPAQTDPIAFHLLHRPDGRDVFLMQYNHMLMDNNATPGLLRLIERLSQDDDMIEESRPSPRSLIRQSLRRTPYPRRRQAALEAIHLQGRVLGGRAVVLGPDGQPASSGKLRIAARSLPPEQSSAIRESVVRACGLPTLSMALLASVFRAIARLAPSNGKTDRNFVAGIGLDINARGANGPFFENLMSMVPISAAPEELGDRDELARLLSGQMRQRLTSRIDLGALQLTAMFSRRPRHIRWVLEYLLRRAISLWYAYFGSLDEVGQTLCGTKIENLFYTGPTWSPVGLTLLVNQFQGRLLFQATYDEDIVPRETVDGFLDLVLADWRRD